MISARPTRMQSAPSRPDLASARACSPTFPIFVRSSASRMWCESSRLCGPRSRRDSTWWARAPSARTSRLFFASLGLEPHVRFLGEQDDLIAILQQSDLFLLPSQTESFGLAALEAMACGVPVVASDVGGVSEVVV